MSFRKVRIFPITGTGQDGYPVYSAPVKLLALESGETEVNSIKITLTPTVASKNLRADDIDEPTESITGYSGDLEVYGIDADALSVLLSNVEKDTNGNIVHLAGAFTDKYVGLFFEGKNEKGKRYQKWLYKVKFTEPNEAPETEGDNATSITLSFKGVPFLVGNKYVSRGTVYEGNTGYVSGEPTSADVYKRTN